MKYDVSWQQQTIMKRKGRNRGRGRWEGEEDGKVRVEGKKTELKGIGGEEKDERKGGKRRRKGINREMALTTLARPMPGTETWTGKVPPPGSASVTHVMLVAFSSATKHEAPPMVTVLPESLSKTNN